MIAALTRFVNEGTTFDRALLQSHGDTGTMWLGNDAIHSWDFAKMGIEHPDFFDRLFNADAWVYFDGCDVADGESGEKFLRAAGKLFLKRKGGRVTGWTSGGLGIPGWVPFIGGHTVHPAGNLVTVRFGPGDTVGTVQVDEQQVVLPALGT
jgi:hypothetical protein